MAGALLSAVSLVASLTNGIVDEAAAGGVGVEETKTQSDPRSTFHVHRTVVNVKELSWRSTRRHGRRHYAVIEWLIWMKMKSQDANGVYIIVMRHDTGFLLQSEDRGILAAFLMKLIAGC
jgi:hypothetical protein